MPTWLPTREADRLVWLQNYALKLSAHLGTAGIVAGDVTLADGVRDSYQWVINRADQLGTARQDITEWKRIFADGAIGEPLGAFPIAPVYPAVPPLFTPTAGAFPQLVALAERVRNTTGYTTAIGEDLGIVPPVGGILLGDPSFTAVAQPNSEVRLNWVKSVSDGVIVEGQRAAETTWTNLGSDRFSPYTDGRDPLVAGQPEVRRYRLRYLDGDDPVGNYSATVNVTTVQ